ncbi:Nup93/Nic96-domain-containing protein [Sporodiniella umbellata]|nr:Nup93/Nic96-domain-containing protein [Sporodiniella umbellata]
MSTKLKQLLKRAEVFSLIQSDDGVPVAGNDFKRLANQVETRNKRIKHSREQHAKGQYFLANNGIKTQASVESTIIRDAFDNLQTDSYTDIEKFLTEEHERIMICTIEDQRCLNDNDFQRFFNAQLNTLAQNNEKKQTEESEQYKMSTNELADNMTKIRQYAHTIKTLNHCRMKDSDYELIEQLSTVRDTSDFQKAQISSSQAWDILNQFIKYTDDGNRREGRFIKNYLVQSPQSSVSVNARRSLISVSKSWLEKQYLQTINDKLHTHATTLELGGMPSITHRLLGYIKIVYKTNSGWKEEKLEVVNDVPIWLFVFLLLRIGYIQAAVDYVRENRDAFQSEKKFFDYFQEYIESPYQWVSKKTHDEMLASYQIFEYGEQKSDPYKSLVYKIIGRCELNKKSFRVLNSHEDYLWLQLALVREVTDTEGYPYERYRLEVLQQLTATSLDPNVDTWAHFRTLLLTLQFEKAIDYIYTQKKLLLESAHFASTLAYYEILNYLYLLTLYSTKRGYFDNDMTLLAKSHLCNIIAKSRDCTDFLTIIHNQKEDHIAGQKEFLSIASDKEYSEQILSPIGKALFQAGRCKEALLTYKMSTDCALLYNALAKELSDALQQLQSAKSARPIISDMTNEEMIQLASEAIHEYESQQYMKSPSEQSVYTVRILMQLLRFRMLYEDGQFDQAMLIVKSLNVIPFSDCFNEIQLAADKFENMDETIKKNLPEVLLNVADTLYKLWESYNSASTNVDMMNGAIGNVEKSIRAVLTFIGIIQFSIPGDMLVKLNR